MRRFYALGVLGATAVAAALGLKVTEGSCTPLSCSGVPRRVAIHV